MKGQIFFNVELDFLKEKVSRERVLVYRFVKVERGGKILNSLPAANVYLGTDKNRNSGIL